MSLFGWRALYILLVPIHSSDARRRAPRQLAAVRVLIDDHCAYRAKKILVERALATDFFLHVSKFFC